MLLQQASREVRFQLPSDPVFECLRREDDLLDIFMSWVYGLENSNLTHYRYVFGIRWSPRTRMIHYSVRETYQEDWTAAFYDFAGFTGASMGSTVKPQEFGGFMRETEGIDHAIKDWERIPFQDLIRADGTGDLVFPFKSVFLMRPRLWDILVDDPYYLKALEHTVSPLGFRNQPFKELL